MEEMLINERFKSPNKEFEKVYILFNKKDYFDENNQVKKKQEEFVRFLKKGDPMATKVFKQHKENMKSSLSFIEDMVRDYNKKNHFEAFQIFSKAVNNIEMKDSKSAEKSGNFIKSKIHNNSQKYSLAIYTAIRKQKFNNYKDVHKDVDELISKNEGFSSDAQRKAAFANGYEEKGKKKNESVNEGKYNYKADALTAYFKGKIDAKELDKIARDDFKSGIATKKELSNFLSNKFTQGVMSDTYGIPTGTLIKRVRGLMKFAEGIGESVVNEATPFHVLFKVKKDISNRSIKPATASYKSESDAKKFLKSVKKDGGKGMIVRRNENSTEDGVPQGYNPMVEDKKQIKDLVKKVKHEKIFYDVLSTMEKKYGKNKYRIWLEKSLKDFGVNPKHYDYRTNASAEEKLFQLGK